MARETDFGAPVVSGRVIAGRTRTRTTEWGYACLSRRVTTPPMQRSHVDVAPPFSGSSAGVDPHDAAAAVNGDRHAVAQDMRADMRPDHRR